MRKEKKKQMIKKSKVNNKSDRKEKEQGIEGRWRQIRRLEEWKKGARIGQKERGNKILRQEK